MFKDNLFSANHRNAMQEKYGFTEAIIVTIEELTQEYTIQKREPNPIFATTNYRQQKGEI